MTEEQFPVLLNGFKVAGYPIIYRLDSRAVFGSNNSLLSKTGVSANRFCSLDQQRNLIFVDMLFPNILADIALECYLGKANSFADYIALPKSFCMCDVLSDMVYFNAKIRTFVKMLLFSNIQHEVLSSGTIYAEKEFLYTFDDGNTTRYTTENMEELLELMLVKMYFNIDPGSCWIENEEFCITLNISVK